MKAVPLPFQEYRGKGVLDFSSGVSDSLLVPQQEQFLQRWNTRRENCCYVGIEPTHPSPPISSSSTLSSSHGSSGGGGGCGSTDSTTGVAAKVSGEKENNPPQAGLEVGQGRCGMGMEDWESVLSDSPGQDHSILKLIMGDIEDPSVGLTKLLQGGSGSQDVELIGVGSSLVDQSSVLDPISGVNFVSSNDPSSGSGNCSDFPFNPHHNVNSNVSRVGSGVNPNPLFPASVSNLSPVSLPQGVFQPQQQQHQSIQSLDEKLQVLNPQFILNQNQAQFMPNPSLVLPLTYAQLQEHQLHPQPPAKRLNCGPAGPNYQVPKTPFLDSGQEMFLRRQQQLQLLPHHLQQRPSSMVVSPKQKMVNPSGSEDVATHQDRKSVV